MTEGKRTDIWLMQVTAPSFVAGSVWEKRKGEWVCTGAAPALSWMVGKRAMPVRRVLRQRGWAYEWIARDVRRVDAGATLRP